MDTNSWFPILVLYTESGKYAVCNDPKDICKDVSFKVIKTKYYKQSNEKGTTYEN